MSVCEYDLLTLTSSAGQHIDQMRGDEKSWWERRSDLESTHTHTHTLQAVRLSEVTSYCMCEELTRSLIWSETGWPQRNAIPRWISEEPAAWLLFRFEVMGYEIYLCLECVCVYLSAMMTLWQRYRVRLFHLYNITDIELVFNPLNVFCILRDTDTWKHEGGTVSEQDQFLRKIIHLE